jgi:hypothetical protein
VLKNQIVSCIINVGYKLEVCFLARGCLVGYVVVLIFSAAFSGDIQPVLSVPLLVKKLYSTHLN